jgi:hypothetical protein
MKSYLVLASPSWPEMQGDIDAQLLAWSRLVRAAADSGGPLSRWRGGVLSSQCAISTRYRDGGTGPRSPAGR